MTKLNSYSIKSLGNSGEYTILKEKQIKTAQTKPSFAVRDKTQYSHEKLVVAVSDMY